MSIEMGFKIIGLWFLLALKAKHLAKYSFLSEVTLLKAGEGFKIAVHHHLDQPIMSIQELDLSPGSVFQVCQCRSSISFLQRIISSPKNSLTVRIVCIVVSYYYNNHCIILQLIADYLFQKLLL